MNFFLNVWPTNMPEFKSIQILLIDIEGTTSDIRFAKDVLFPYSAKHMAEFLKANAQKPAIQNQLKNMVQNDVPSQTSQLLQWITNDVKHPVLKAIQGYIWKDAYEKGEFKSHLYPDVKPALEAWRKQGLQLAIYSSGSVAAQKQFYTYTIEGDLLPLFSHHFDLEVGGKKETKSYIQIANNLGTNAQNILFLSDIEEELLAAQSAGLQVIHIVRPGTEKSTNYPHAENFTQIKLT
jgi:enolase-phosphatase E1